MKLTRQKQLNILAERTHDLKKNISEKDKQRRNQVVDLFGEDISRQSSNGEATMHVSVSPDLVYYERFQFKIYIDDAPTLTNFQVWAWLLVKQSNGSYQRQNVDLTPYLKATAVDEDGQILPWVNGDNGGKAWPNDNLDEGASKPEDQEDDPQEVETANFYDLLEVADMMYAEGKDEIAEGLLRPELKKFRFIADQNFFASMIMYLKYSHLGR